MYQVGMHQIFGQLGGAWAICYCPANVTCFDSPGISRVFNVNIISSSDQCCRFSQIIA